VSGGWVAKDEELRISLQPFGAIDFNFFIKKLKMGMPTLS
jgi:hypothetical protein